MKIGPTLQKIRKNRQLSQTALAQGIMTQGAYSKIEQAQLQLNMEQCIPLLLKLNVSLHEFTYIMNDFELDERQAIIFTFTSLEIDNASQLQVHLQQIKSYLMHHPDDSFIQHLQYVYEAFLILRQGNNLAKARERVSPIWLDMQKLDDWYINDFELLNAILFLFPLEIAKEIVTTAFRRLEKYRDYNHDLSYLKIYLKVDLSFHYIEMRAFEDGLQLLEETEQAYIQQMSYKIAAILFERKAICLFYLQRPYETELHKMNQLLTIYQDEPTRTLLMMEFEQLTRRNVT